jgi:hypothetical protein
MNPTGVADVNEIPNDAVAVMIWRASCGPNPTTIIATRQSYDWFLERMVAEGGLSQKETYEFESPTPPQGRKSRFWFTDVTGITINYHSGVITPA